MRINTKIILIILSIGAIANVVAKQPDNNSDNAVWADYGAVGMSGNNEFYSSSYRISSNGESPIDDVVAHVKFCPKTSAFICIQGNLWHFAVPRHKLSVGEKWDFANVHFEVITAYGHVIPGGRIPNSERTERIMEVLGNTVNYYAIKAVDDKDPDVCVHIYMFSIERGLIGETGRCNQTRGNKSISLLEELYGPGSIQFDSKISKDATLSNAKVLQLSK